MTDPSHIRLIDSAPANTPGTACGFEIGARPCGAIDYIYHTPQWKSDDYQLIQNNDGKYYPSDYLPVMVALSLDE